VVVRFLYFLRLLLSWRSCYVSIFFFLGVKVYPTQDRPGIIQQSSRPQCGYSRGHINSCFDTVTWEGLISITCFQTFSVSVFMQGHGLSRPFSYISSGTFFTVFLMAHPLFPSFFPWTHRPVRLSMCIFPPMVSRLQRTGSCMLCLPCILDSSNQESRSRSPFRE
jgi:hypothetical protein